MGSEPTNRRDFDEVDAIISAWNTQRPDLDVTPLAILSRLTRLGRHLDLARRGAFARHDLESWEFDVLVALRRAGEPYTLSPGALVTQTMVTSGTMTNRIDRLTQRGLVVREPALNDRRGVQVKLTPVGLTYVDSAFEDLLRVEHDLISALSPGQSEQLASILKLLLSQFTG